jgi:hypothetical protein
MASVSVRPPQQPLHGQRLGSAAAQAVPAPQADEAVDVFFSLEISLAIACEGMQPGYKTHMV